MAKTGDVLGSVIGILTGLAEGEAVKRLTPEIEDGLQAMDEPELLEFVADLKAALAHVETLNPTSSKRQIKKASKRLSEAFVTLLIRGI